MPHAVRPALTAYTQLGLICVGLLLLSLSGVRAQDVRVGGRIGPTFGFLNDSPAPFVSEKGITEAHTNIRLDIHAGLHAVVSVADQLSIQPELLYVQKGGHLARIGPEIYVSELYRLSYLQLHLLARRSLSRLGPLSFHAVAGPTVARATGGAVRRNIRTRTDVLHQRIVLMEHDLMRGWDVGLLFGAGVEYPVGTGGTVALDLRYNPGLRTIFTDARRPSSQVELLSDPPPLSRTPPPLRHDVILVSLVYTMSLGR